MIEAPATRKVKKIPVLMFRRVSCEHEGRTEMGKRLKDMYVAPLANGQGWLVVNFSGAMLRVEGKCPFPEATLEDVPVKAGS